MDEKKNISVDKKSRGELSKSEYMEELKAFDDTKANVKGLVDAGVLKSSQDILKTNRGDAAWGA